MMVRIGAKGFQLTSALTGFIRQQVRRRLGRVTSNGADVLITLSDVNGPRGGADKRCRVLLGLNGRRHLVAQSVASDMYHAIDESLARVQKRLLRQQYRRRRIRRQPRIAARLAEAS